MSVPVRSEIRLGLRVQIVEKQNQPTGALTEGIVARILTKNANTPARHQSDAERRHSGARAGDR
jgi:uncharacterized repeat protein (TIGR03833 family)